MVVSCTQMSGQNNLFKLIDAKQLQRSFGITLYFLSIQSVLLPKVGVVKSPRKNQKVFTIVYFIMMVSVATNYCIL